MSNKINFAQLTNASELWIIRTDKIDYKNINIAGATTVTLGTDLGMVKKSYSFKSINCGESTCNNKARDFSTTSNAVDVAFPIQYSTTDVKEGALVVQYASSVDLPTASVVVRVYVTGDSANYNEYVVETAKYVDANTAYSAVIKLTDAEGTLITPTAIGGTGLGSAGTPEIQLVVTDAGVASYTLSVLNVSFIPDVSDLNCQKILKFGCINTVQYNSTLDTVLKRCFPSDYSTAPVEEELTTELLGLPVYFHLLDPRAKLNKNVGVGRLEVAEASVSAKTVNGINYGAYQLPSTFASSCNITSVELPTCGGLNEADIVCTVNASQDLLGNEYVIFEESGDGTITNWVLVDDQYVGQTITITYTVADTGCLVTFDDGNMAGANFEIVIKFDMVDTNGVKSPVETRISNVKPTSFPSINLSGTDEVTNSLSFKFKRTDVSFDVVC